MATASKSRITPKWHPASGALVHTFEKALLAVPEAQLRTVFGYPAAFINGQMFAGLHQDNMILRLSGDDRVRFLQLKGSRVFEPMIGHPMREYVVVPPSVMNSDTDLGVWLTKALAYAKRLPPKPPKPARTTVKGP